MRRRITLGNIWSYLLGNYRYKLYYSYLWLGKDISFLIRGYIREQIKVRINSMDRDCYTNGECKICGCSTTALQMADKSCDNPCYPDMLSKDVWEGLKMGYVYIDKGIEWSLINSRFYGKLVK